MVTTEQVKKVLITGGTSGLGLDLVNLFLGIGFYVVATGTRDKHPSGASGKLSYYKVDFSDLENTASVFRRVVNDHVFDIVINNAGILSPAQKKVTKDNHEYTFQVNFLAHFLVSEMIMQKQNSVRDIRMVTITSPVYKIAGAFIREPETYNGLKAYSRSKLFQAMMCVHLSKLYGNGRNIFFSFDPGTFGSGIYRMRGSFFSFLYKIAFPFMRSSSKIARALAEILTGEEIIPASIYNFRKDFKPVPVPEKDVEEAFWRDCSEMISIYL